MVHKQFLDNKIMQLGHLICIGYHYWSVVYNWSHPGAKLNGSLDVNCISTILQWK